MAFSGQFKWDEALAALRAAVEKDPEMSEAWFQIGMTEVMKNGGKPCEEAHEPLARCLQLDPNHAAAHFGFGDVLLHVRKDDVRAEEHFRAAIRLNPHCSAAKEVRKQLQLPKQAGLAAKPNSEAKARVPVRRARPAAAPDLVRLNPCSRP